MSTNGEKRITSIIYKQGCRVANTSCYCVGITKIKWQLVMGQCCCKRPVMVLVRVYLGYGAPATSTKVVLVRS